MADTLEKQLSEAFAQTLSPNPVRGPMLAGVG